MVATVVVSNVCVQQVRNLGTGQCVDSAAKPEDNHKPVGLWPCHRQGGNQVSGSTLPPLRLNMGQVSGICLNSLYYIKARDDDTGE